MAIFINQDHATGVVETAGRAGVFFGHAKVVVGYTVDSIVVAGNEVPLFSVDPQLHGVTAQRSYGVIAYVNGVGKHQHTVGVFEPFVNPKSVGFYLWANSRAVDKKEIYDIYFAGKSGIVHDLAVLINELKIRNGWVQRVAAWGDIALAKDREWPIVCWGETSAEHRGKTDKKGKTEKETHHVVSEFCGKVAADFVNSGHGFAVLMYNK